MTARSAAPNGIRRLVDPAAGVDLDAVRLAGAAEAVRAELAAHGIAPGEVVLVQLDNSWRHAALEVALAHLDAVTAPIPVQWRHREVQDARRQVGASWMLRPGEHTPVELVDLRTGPSVPVDSLAMPQVDHPTAPTAPVAGVVLAASVLGEGTRWVRHEPSTADFGLGRCAEAWGLNASTHVLIASAAGFLAGYQWGFRLARSLGSRATVLARWDAAAAARLIEDEGCDFIYGTGRQLRELVAALSPSPDRDMVFALAASQPVPEDLRRAQELGCTVIPTYGQPESFLMATCRRDDSLERRQSCRGAALPDTVLTTWSRSDDDWQEIVTTGGHVGTYVSGAGAPGDRAIIGSTLRTGDQGRIDEDGFLHWERSHLDVIVRSGINVSPLELEALLESHPEILRARVRAVPSERHGEEIEAVVDVAGPVDVDQVRAFLHAEGIAGFKQPDHLVVQNTYAAEARS